MMVCRGIWISLPGAELIQKPDGSVIEGLDVAGGSWTLLRMTAWDRRL